MVAVPAPDGRPARPMWQVVGITVGYLAAWALLGYALIAVLR